MAEFVFTSPGVKFKERDLTFVTRNVGITTLGLVGETLKGPAFEPVFIQDKTQFAQRFGAQSTRKIGIAKTGSVIPQYQVPYVANAYLEESNQLFVTRVLGLSGYDAGKAWELTLSAGVDLSTTATTASVSFTSGFTDNIFLGVNMYTIGDNGTWFSGFVKNNGFGPDTFTGYLKEFTCVTITGDTGTVTGITHTLSGASLTEYEDMVLAVIRSRGLVQDHPNLPPTTDFYTQTLTMTGNQTLLGTGDLFGLFVLQAVSGATVETYTASLNPNSSSFLPNVIGSEPKDKNTMIWVEATYPDLIKKLDAEGIGYGINTTLLVGTANSFTDYNAQFQTPETPWVVSQIKGSTVDRLFKFVSISDGNAANQEIKISIQNIKPDSLEFDVVVREFYDTDENPNILETFSRCTMIKGLTSYIAQRIGTTDGEYDLQSKYIMVELAENLPLDVFPAGFEGYQFMNFTGITGVEPKIFYKTEYLDSEKVKKVYLGVSEKAYDAHDIDGTVTLVGTGINQNFFNYCGKGGFVKTQGFHMDSGATGITSFGYSFDCGVGPFQTIYDVVDPEQTYYQLATRKFTLVPAGGFDGWNVNRGATIQERSNSDGFAARGLYDGVPANQTDLAVNDFQAWETAIHTFDNPEEVTINLFATPGLTWYDNTVLVQETIEMIETQRTDSLYIIDAPDFGMPQIVGQAKSDVASAQDIASALADTEISSSYACTYFPWIQIRDTQNNVNIYLPPTGEVVKAMAFTDNTKFPWFAPAGLQRGVTDARKSKFKLSLEARDTLYAARINPMADFADAGTAIFGQKTLQIKESALDRINVRRLLLQIKVLIANIAIRLVFEQNDQATIDQFLQKATPILDTIKRERGLTEFRIKMDDSNNTPETRDRNELFGEIFLKPTRAVEFIGITFTITPSGASFADVGA
jgi:hypothetical protein